MHNAKVKVEMKQLVDRHTVKLIFDYCCVQARNSLYKVISIVNTAYVHVRTDGIERTSNRILQQSPLADASQRPSYRFLDRRHHIISTDEFPCCPFKGQKNLLFIFCQFLNVCYVLSNEIGRSRLLASYQELSVASPPPPLFYYFVHSSRSHWLDAKIEWHFIIMYKSSSGWFEMRVKPPNYFHLYEPRWNVGD